MTVATKAFKSEYGFESGTFNVDSAGRITAPRIDVKSILINGVPFVGQEDDDDTGGGGGGGETANPFDNVASLTVNQSLLVNYNSNQQLRVSNGTITISPDITGELNNVNIGLETPGQARLYHLEMVGAPDSTASIISADGATLEGTITVDGSLRVSGTPTDAGDLTPKSYVDSTALALSIALGA